MCVILRTDQTKSELAQYLHVCCFSPTKTTFLKVIRNGNFHSWPGLTPELISKHLPPSIATLKGHIRQEQQGLQSTKKKVIFKKLPEDPSIAEDFFPTSESPNLKSKECYITIEQRPLRRERTYSDQTGRCHVASSRGNEYVTVLYDYDSNAILAEPIKSRAAVNIRDAILKLLQPLQESGHTPKLHIMDNECSDILRAALRKHKIPFQLVPPHVHRRNAAERAIQTLKNHFIAGLESVDPKFPATDWDRLIFQAVLSLNLLHNSRVNPRLSAYATVFGPFDFNRTPLAPPGTRVLIHAKPDKRKSWAPRGTDAWYIGPSMEHYRCVKCYNTKTFAETDVDTVTYLPTVIPLPRTTTEDFLRQNVSDILAILNSPGPQHVGLQCGDALNDAIASIARLLHRAAPRKTLPPSLIDPTSVTPSPPVTPSAPSSVPIAPQPSRTIPNRPLLQANPVPPPAPYPPLPQRMTTRSMARAVANHLSKMTDVQAPRVSERIQKNCEPTVHTRAFAAMHLSRQWPLNNIHHIYDDTGRRETFDTLVRANPDRWNRKMGNELGRLAQGVGTRMPTGTDTLRFIPKSHVPADRKATYANAVCDHRPHKEEEYRVCLTVGGDRLEYPHDPAAPAASLLESKLIFNSTISTPGARFMSVDIKDYFLNNPMDRYEYMRIPLRWFPQEILEQYNILDIASPDGYVYCEIRKGMYGLKQAARLAFDRLVINLKKHGYAPLRRNPGLWTHDTLPTVFALCVDDFGIKYLQKSHADHLINALKASYKITIDWEGKNYCGLSLNWNYTEGYVDLSMPKYILSALHKFQHVAPTRPQHAPHAYARPDYGTKIQYARTDNSALLQKNDIRLVQSILGTLLYYARALDSTMLPALNELAAKQAAPTQETLHACHRLLDYAATHPDAAIRYNRSAMILNVDSDAAYLVLPKARSRVAGYFYLSDAPSSSAPHPPLNGALTVECSALRNVVSSAAEAETGGIFKNSQKAVALRADLIAIGHPQPPTPIKTDNKTSRDIITSLCKPKKSKSWDMRYHWVEDRIHEKQLNLHWKPGSQNWADYFTKHHAPLYHQILRYKYLQRINLLTALTMLA